MAEVRLHFRPEFLNRLDELVIFQQLSCEQLRQVARLLVRGMPAPACCNVVMPTCLPVVLPVLASL